MNASYCVKFQVDLPFCALVTFQYIVPIYFILYLRHKEISTFYIHIYPV